MTDHTDTADVLASMAQTLLRNRHNDNTDDLRTGVLVMEIIRAVSDCATLVGAASEAQGDAIAELCRRYCIDTR